MCKVYFFFCDLKVWVDLSRYYLLVKCRLKYRLNVGKGEDYGYIDVGYFEYLSNIIKLEFLLIWMEYI